jgi:ABC-type sulfate/molybdate transport systems ATPase subunit
VAFFHYALFLNRTVAANIAYGLPRGSAACVTELLRRGEPAARRALPHRSPVASNSASPSFAHCASPRILLSMSPSNLDASPLAMREELVILRAEGMTAVLVPDRTDAMAAADRIAVMDAA